MKQSPIWHLYMISFIEGGALMAVELIGAKLVTPHYGNSIYVWAAALGFTLLGLMSGYFLGGWMSMRFPNRRILYTMVFISGLVVAAMPITAAFILAVTSHLPLKIAVMISELLILLPPVVLFGVVSPMIIRLITLRVEDVGSSAGRIYAISTAGGIVLNFFMGLYSIPFIGVRYSAWLTAALLAISAGYFLIFQSQDSKPESK
jgi:MFS family permease